MLVLDKAETIKGWMSTPELQFLAQRARESELIIEFGSYHGRSTRALADNTNGVVFAVDPWNGIYFDDKGNQVGYIEPTAYEKFQENLRDHLDNEKVIPFQMYSYDFPIRGNQLADFIFIDGDHRREAVKEDIQIALYLIKNGGIIAGHDYGRADWPGVKRAVDELFPDGVNKVDTIWWIQKS